MNAGARISLRNDSNLCGGERGQASQRTGMVGLLLATKQKRGSHIVPSNSFTSGYEIRLSLDFFCLMDNAGRINHRTQDVTYNGTHQGTHGEFTRKYTRERAV